MPSKATSSYILSLVNVPTDFSYISIEPKQAEHDLGFYKIKVVSIYTYDEDVQNHFNIDLTVVEPTEPVDPCLSAVAEFYSSFRSVIN